MPTGKMGKSEIKVEEWRNWKEDIEKKILELVGENIEIYKIGNIGKRREGKRGETL